MVLLIRGRLPYSILLVSLDFQWMFLTVRSKRVQQPSSWASLCFVMVQEGEPYLIVSVVALNRFIFLVLLKSLFSDCQAKAFLVEISLH